MRRLCWCDRKEERDGAERRHHHTLSFAPACLSNTHAANITGFMVSRDGGRHWLRLGKYIAPTMQRPCKPFLKDCDNSFFGYPIQSKHHPCDYDHPVGGLMELGGSDRGLSPSSVSVRDSRIVFFHHVGMRHDRSSIIRHEVRHRRFVSMRTADAIGSFTTHPLLVPQSVLAIGINIAIRAAAGRATGLGWASVALLGDGEGEGALPGFSHALSERIIRSDPLHLVSWRADRTDASGAEGPPLAPLSGRYVRLQVRSRLADVFGIQFLVSDGDGDGDGDGGGGRSKAKRRVLRSQSTARVW